jgi:5-methyltetrahydropteroyltriglutamate--homocysteine methyltransferase
MKRVDTMVGNQDCIGNTGSACRRTGGDKRLTRETHLITPRTAALPPFYTHVIGSLPRPRMVVDLLESRSEMSGEEHQVRMQEMKIFAIRLQERAGIDVVSDGEWSRVSYINAFLDPVNACERVRPYTHQGESKKGDVFVRRMDYPGPIFAREAEFLANNTDRVTKFALPSPFLLATRFWHEDFSVEAYPTRRHLMDHLSELLRLEAESIVDAGIDVVQLDDPALTYFCDRALQGQGATHDERLRQDWDIVRQIPEALEFINQILDGLKAETHLHCCHSVYRRQADVTGDYKPILPYFKEAKIDRINLEFAYQDTGATDDLKSLPENLAVGMGVLDIRGEKLQTVEEIEAIALEGARYVPAERIALNPDCGFSPGTADPPSIDEAYEKLSRLAEAARRVRARM